MHKSPIKILFNVFANEDSVNAQSLNAREIALRLNPERYEGTFFLSKGIEPDARLRNKSNIHFVILPRRLGSLVIAMEMLWGQQDVLFYPEANNRASRIFWVLKAIGRKKKVIVNIEASLDQLYSIPEFEVKRYLKNVRAADYCFSITPFISDSFRDKYGINSRIIPVGVNLDIFKNVDRTNHELPVRVLFVGSIQPRKQTHLILDLADKLRKEQVEFNIIGPVISQHSYKQNLLLEKEHRKLENVFFHDAMVQKEIYEWMRKSDVFILPSRAEGFGKVTLEAAATGLPCIVFNDYHTTAVIDNVTGFQVKTFDEMTDRLKLLIDDKDLRIKMGAAAVEHAKKFDWDILAKKWEEVFEEAVKMKNI